MACGTLEENSMFAVQPDLLKTFFPVFVCIQCCSVVLPWFCKYVYDIDLYCFFFMGIIAEQLKLLPGSKTWLVAVQIPKPGILIAYHISVRFRTYLMSL